MAALNGKRRQIHRMGLELVKEKRPTRISSITLESDGHNFNTWRREIPATLQWISGCLNDR